MIDASNEFQKEKPESNQSIPFLSIHYLIKNYISS